jgi:hypothetical protein
MLRLIVMLAFTLSVSFSFAQEEPSQVAKAYTAQVILTQERSLHSLKQNLAKAETDFAVLKQRYKSVNSTRLDQLLAEPKQIIAKLKADIKAVYGSSLGLLDLNDLHAGEVGFLGADSLLVPVRINQVTGPNSVLVRSASRSYLLEVDTTGLVDNEFHSFVAIFVVEGTTTYQTVAGGTNTVFKLRALKDEELKSAVAYASEHKLKQPRDIQTWKDLQGKLLVEGEFVSRDKQKVVVSDKDGKQVDLEYNKLSRENRIWLKDR